MKLTREYMDRQADIRRDILMRLYEQRAANPKPPKADYLWEKNLLQELGYAPDETSFAMSYLAEAGEISVDGKHVRITAAGIRAVEAKA